MLLKLSNNPKNSSYIARLYPLFMTNYSYWENVNSIFLKRVSTLSLTGNHLPEEEKQ
jgi:hypothetical protein